MANNDEKGRIWTGAKIPYNEEAILTTGTTFPKDDKTLDLLTKSNGFGAAMAPLTSTLYGLDIFNQGSPAQQTHESYGLVFFTRPMLNLSYYNLKADRIFTPMMTNNANSIAGYVRAILDPIGAGYAYVASETNGKSANKAGDWPTICSMVDPHNPFIPILSNSLMTLTGWRDPILETYQSPAGLKKEQWMMADSSNKVYGTYELSVSFRNIRGNFLSYLFHVWQTYMALVYEGVVDPLPAMIKSNVIDYQTRIWRLTLDASRTFVEEIVSCTAAMPLANPLGVRANINQMEPINKEVDIFNQSFLCSGAHYIDPLQVHEFNNTVGILNSDFRNPTKRKEHFRRLWPNEYKIFTYRAYPYINEKTARLEWWVPKVVHRAAMGDVTYSGYNIDD